MPRAESAAIRKELHEGVLQARAFAEFWLEKGPELMRIYGGEWVAFHRTQVVAHAVDPADLEKQLERLRKPREDLMLRYVPRSDERFVL